METDEDIKLTWIEKIYLLLGIIFIFTGLYLIYFSFLDDEYFRAILTLIGLAISVWIIVKVFEEIDAIGIIGLIYFSFLTIALVGYLYIYMFDEINADRYEKIANFKTKYNVASVDLGAMKDDGEISRYEYDIIEDHMKEYIQEKKVSDEYSKEYDRKQKAKEIIKGTN